MHAATKHICDPDKVYKARFLALGTLGMWSEFSEVTKNFKGPDASEKYHISWADWGGLHCLKNTVASGRDLTALGRCGMRVDFSEHLMETLDLGSAEVLYQDALAAHYGNLVVQIIQLRAGSNLYYTSYYPMKLALLLSPRTRAAGIEYFKNDVAAWQASANFQYPKVKKSEMSTSSTALS